VDQIIGTADYMSPEQARGKPVDARTDVYALGVVLYQMLTGEVPFHSTTIHGLLFQHVYTPPPTVREKNPHVPEILAQITARALAKAPADRFQSAEAMAQALDFANSHATNPLTSFAQGELTIPIAPPSGQSSNQATPYLPQPQFSTNPQRQLDSYATRPEAQTGPSMLRVTQASGAALPTTNPGITGAPLPITRKRSLPLSYILATLVLIACIAVAGIRFFPHAPNGSPGAPTKTGQAQPFLEHFQNNDRGWQAGTLNNGITETLPSGGQYKVTVPQDRTAFPYPQNVGALPDNFTLTATIQETSGEPAAFYGIVLHFSQQSSGISGYAFVINNSGQCLIIKYTSATSTPASTAQSSYNTPGQTSHTLKVQAQGIRYSFFVDNQAVKLATSSNPSNTIWSDGDLHGGDLTLFLAGPASGAAVPSTTYVASLVQLSIP
jgi:serine/threonine protein kinase